MPRLRKVMGYYPAAQIRQKRSRKVTKAWDEECAREVEIDNFFHLDKAKHDVAPREYVRESHFISFCNSKKKRFNSCTHLVKKIDLGHSNIRAHAEYYYPRTARYRRCDDGGWISLLDERTYDAVFRNIPIEILGNYLKLDECIIQDTYLGIGSDTFDTKVAGLVQGGLEEMIPKLDDGFSTPLFLWELADLKRMWVNCMDLSKNLPKTWRRLAKKPLKEISDSWLSACFGWLPFARDIQVLWDKYHTVANDVENFLSNMDKRMTLHYEKYLSPLTFQDPGYFAVSPLPGFTWDVDHPDNFWAEEATTGFHLDRQFYKTVDNLVFHQTLDFKYSIPALSPFLTRFYAELDVYGMSPNISDVWNAIPFSFVVDWVFNVGSWLENYDTAILPVTVDILDYCHSLKYEHCTVVEAKPQSEEGTILYGVYDDMYLAPDKLQTDVSPDFPRACETLTAYHRWVGIPSQGKASWPKLTTPNGMQISLGAALIGSRR